MEGFLAEFLQNYIYGGVLIVLLLCGLGLPIPEELLLVFAGYLVYEKLATYPHMALLCLGGVILGDILIFGFGHHIGNNLIQHRFVRRLITEQHRDRVWAYFQQHGNKTIFLGRFLTGLRAPLFFTAGSIRMGFSKFLRMDAVAALISVPLIVFLGSYFGSHIQKLILWIKRLDLSILIVGIVLSAGLLIFLRIQKRKKQQVSTKTTIKL